MANFISQENIWGGLPYIYLMPSNTSNNRVTESMKFIILIKKITVYINSQSLNLHLTEVILIF